MNLHFSVRKKSTDENICFDGSIVLLRLIILRFDDNSVYIYNINTYT